MNWASRGEIWVIEFDPIRGREQAGTRPGLVVSVDIFNHGPSELAVAIPITSRFKKNPFHVRVEPPEGGVALLSYVKCEDVKSISTSRLVRRLGKVSTKTLSDVEDRLRILLGL
jgi:mRNA interferase MazF